ncbi:MAG: hypothetical protein ACUVXJ_05350 [Phycisphaerae bacterium]
MTDPISPRLLRKAMPIPKPMLCPAGQWQSILRFARHSLHTLITCLRRPDHQFATTTLCV